METCFDYYRMNHPHHFCTDPIFKYACYIILFMLTFVGLGLHDVDDLTLRGKKAIEKADVIFAEFYTSHPVGMVPEDVGRLLKKDIRILTREEVEKGEIIIEEAARKNVVLLVAGDPMIATTHVSLRVMAEEQGIKTNIVHNASIVTAAPGFLGLQQYKFGRTVSLPFPQENYFPTSAYDFIRENAHRGLRRRLWEKSKSPEWKKKYSHRNIVEPVFHSFKRLVGDYIFSRSLSSASKLLLFKVLAYDLYV